MAATVSGVGVESVEYSHDERSVRTQFAQEKTPPSLAIIATLADVMDTEPVELSPLQSTVDTEALDALVQVRSGTTGDIHVTFTHEGYEIRVHSYGVVTVTHPDHAPAAGDDERGAGR